MAAARVLYNRDLREHIRAFAPEHRERLRAALERVPARALRARVRRWRRASTPRCCIRCDVKAAMGDDPDRVFEMVTFEECARIMR